MSGRRMLPMQRAVAAAAAVLISVVWPAPAAAQLSRRVVAVTAGATADLRDWDQRITRMERDGELRVRQLREDTLVEGRAHERLDQYHRGVRVFGADVARQLSGGQLVSLFGTLYDDIPIGTTPEVSAERAREIVSERAGVSLPESNQPELVVLPLDSRTLSTDSSQTYVLAWRIRAANRRGVRQYFVDAGTGSMALEFSDLKTQTAVGRARGVLGDSKKISITPGGGQFFADDGLRPPSLETYDMKGNFDRTLDYLDGFLLLNRSDVAIDADNDWTDGAVVDAHVYTGLTYDYYFKRMNRRGLDNRDIPIVSLVHPVRRQDVFDLFDQLDFLYVNAFYFGNGVMVYGEGLPGGVTLGGQSWDFTSGALDIVAHELTHGVTEFSSNLIYQNESGALNEAISDIMAVGVEFTFQQAGTASRQADYLIGEDVIRPGGLRSLANPGVFGDPDHYSRRFVGTDDNGGVHINSTIAGHAFYLAVEGGTNRTSGLSVTGVGAANREQMERVFYRAFMQMLPAGATFSVARAATMQAARDLFGNNSAAERAVTEAWTAVGVS